MKVGLPVVDVMNEKFNPDIWRDLEKKQSALFEIRVTPHKMQHLRDTRVFVFDVDDMAFKRMGDAVRLFLVLCGARLPEDKAVFLDKLANAIIYLINSFGYENAVRGSFKVAPAPKNLKDTAA